MSMPVVQLPRDGQVFYSEDTIEFAWTADTVIGGNVFANVEILHNGQVVYSDIIQSTFYQFAIGAGFATRGEHTVRVRLVFLAQNPADDRKGPYSAERKIRIDERPGGGGGGSDPVPTPPR